MSKQCHVFVCWLLLLLELRVSLMCMHESPLKLRMHHSPFRERSGIWNVWMRSLLLLARNTILPVCHYTSREAVKLELFWAPSNEACLLPCVSSPVGVPPSVSSWASLDSALARPTVHGDCPDGLKGGKAFPSNEKRLTENQARHGHPATATATRARATILVVTFSVICRHRRGESAKWWWWPVEGPG